MTKRRSRNGPAQPRHHLLIAGTGRAGTSFLVRLLTECGLDTELSRDPQSAFHAQANAGFETIPLLKGDHPYIVKSPWSYQFVRELLASPQIVIDEILIPIRSLSEATASRITLEMRDQSKTEPWLDELEDIWRERGTVPGGIVYSLEPLDQARILAHSLHILVEHAESKEIPYRFISFPRFLDDPDYLYRRIGHLLPDSIDINRFREIIKRVHQPAMVRMETELEAEKPGTWTTDSELPPLPSLEMLSRVAQKREIADLRARLTTLERLVNSGTQQHAVAEIAKVANPDSAPPGFSYGDWDMDGFGLRGWQYLTLPRPNDSRYAAQMAFSDTSHYALYRNCTEGFWSNWKALQIKDIPTPPRGEPVVS